MRLRLTLDERNQILKQREEAKWRIAERKEKLQRLYDTLSLPPNEALPILRHFINDDFKILFNPRVAKWCVDNSAAIVVERAKR